MPEPVLSADAVEKTYGSGHGAVRAVRGIDLALEPGERVLVMGPSGSGKTTLVSMLGGMLTPSAGRVVLGGEDVYAHDEKERASLRLEKVGFIFQSFNLLSALTARENVELPLRLTGAGGGAARGRASELLERLGLGERESHRPRDLSGGEKQRVAIARALANRPEIVLADEPTANLDSETGRQVADILCRLGCEEGKGVVIVSHDQRLLDIASRVVWIEDGRLTEGPRNVGLAAAPA
ncbi:MAG: ABC transporter ATP-binding protein [Actinomycetota bacterium]